MVKKYTIKEFFESKEKLAIHTPTKAESIKLCKAFDDAGYSLIGDVSYVKNCSWVSFGETVTYNNKFGYCSIGYHKSNNYTILKLEDIIFEDDNEPKDYNVKIEVKLKRERYNVYINDVEIDSWCQETNLDYDIFCCINGIIEKDFTQEELQEYLLENHFVDTPIQMTIKEIKEKLEIENLVIVEGKDE